MCILYDHVGHIGCSCEDDKQCSADESCCSSTCVNETNCLGRHCKRDRDCFQYTSYHRRRGEENCCGGVCIDQYLKVSSLGCYCRYHSSCFTGVESCCANTCVNGSSCVGFSCNDESPKCAHGETCCSNNFKCVIVNGTDCLDQSFTPFIRALVTVFASFGVSLFLIITYLCYRRKKRILRETLLLQAEDITTEQALDSQLFPLLPPYQPDDYAPPGYEQHQTDINRSYYPQTIEGHEPPPPYSAEFQGESGGEHTKI